MKVTPAVTPSALPKENRIPGNIVFDSTGRWFISTIGGVYAHHDEINGVAFTDVVEKAKIKAQVIGNKANLAVYTCNNLNRELEELLSEITLKCNKEAGAVFCIDLYSITKNGIVESIRRTDTPIRIVIGLPEHMRGKEVSLLCIDQENNTVIFEDMDSDPWTITIDATVFGTYAFTYAQ